MMWGWGGGGPESTESGENRRSLRLLLTTNSEDSPMAPAAIIGLNTPAAARGMGEAVWGPSQPATRPSR